MKARDCRVSACIDGECRGCRRKRAERREEAAKHVREQVARRGWTSELTARASQIVTLAYAEVIVSEAARGELVEWL